MQQHERMEVKYFVYFLIALNFLLLIFNGFFWMMGILHKAGTKNELVLIVFSILEILVLLSIIWSFAILKLHQKKNYSKTTIILLGLLSIIGVPIVQPLLWFIHFTNWKITKNNIQFHIQKVEEERKEK